MNGLAKPDLRSRVDIYFLAILCRWNDHIMGTRRQVITFFLHVRNKHHQMIADSRIRGRDTSVVTFSVGKKVRKAWQFSTLQASTLLYQFQQPYIRTLTE